MKRLWEVLEETRDAIEGDIGYMRGVDIVGEPMYQVDQERLIARMAAERDRARAQIRAREELMPEPLCIKRGERMRPVVLTAQHVLNTVPNRDEQKTLQDTVHRKIRDNLINQFRVFMQENIQFYETVDERGKITIQGKLELTSVEKGVGLLKEFLKTPGMEDNYESAINVGADRFKVELPIEFYERIKSIKE